jgi:hypothetical protein
MWRVKLLVPTALALAILGGCGDSSPSEVDGTEGAAVKPQGDRVPRLEADAPGRGEADEAPGTRPQPLERAQGAAGAGRSRPPVPTGVALNTRNPQVRKAIADLLAPRKGAKARRSGDEDKNGSAAGLDEVLKQLTKGGGQPAPDSAQRKASPESGDGGLEDILDQLK